MTSSLEAFPECWQPLNWSRFEETLQALVLGQDNRTLNARVTYLNITLDCLVASRRRRRRRREKQQNLNSCTTATSGHAGGGVQAGAGAGAGAPAAPLLPQLFLGAGGDRDGRAALKRCSKWAAKVWAQRHAGTTASMMTKGGSNNKNSSSIEDNVTNARVCVAVSRAMGEALEAFRTAGRGGGVGVGGSSSALELEGCQLAAVELEFHGEVGPSAAGAGSAGAQKEKEATAKCRAGLMRSLGGRPFCPTLAGVLLQNMPSSQGTNSNRAGGAGTEVERLKALLRRQQQQQQQGVFAGLGAGVGGGGGGVDGEKAGTRGGGGSSRSGGAKGAQRGSDMLLADMMILHT